MSRLNEIILETLKDSLVSRLERHCYILYLIDNEQSFEICEKDYVNLYVQYLDLLKTCKVGEE
jgi:hypothetical protein